LTSKAHSPLFAGGGTTIAEALYRGCVFTPLAFGWLPPHCLDKELAEEFDKQCVYSFTPEICPGSVSQDFSIF
jgi:hypothetical protein